MWDPVPSRVGVVADSGAVTRNTHFAGIGGKEGVVTPAALEVRALAVPGASVRVAPGTVAIANRAVGMPDEVYVARCTAQETLPVTAAGTSPRSDLIVARIEDPYVAGSPYPALPDPTTGPYTFLRVISNVPAGTTTAAGLSVDRSEYALARIDLPANATTVTQDMIVDLRALTHAAQVTERTVRVTHVLDEVSVAATGVLAEWVGDVLPEVTIPAWATHARATILAVGVRFGAAGDNAGAGWTATGDVRIGWDWSGDPGYGPTIPFTVDSPQGVTRATLLAVADAQPIPATRRGGPLSLSLQGRRDVGGDDAAALLIDPSVALSVDLEFYADVESNGE